MSWSRNVADLQALRTRQARPGCEFNQKRCELKNFLNINIMHMKMHMLICLFISTSVACAVGSKCYLVLNRFFLPKPGFFGNLFEFSVAEITSKSNISHIHSESKSYQINSINSCSSRSFQQHQTHIPIPPKFSTTV